jgi:hypothetical protein
MYGSNGLRGASSVVAALANAAQLTFPLVVGFSSADGSAGGVANNRLM